MSRTCLMWGVFGCLTLCANGFVAAQQNAQRTESQTMVRRSSMVIGGTVSLKGGYNVGKIEDFIIDDGGCISMVVVTYGDYYVAMPWNVSEFDFSQRTLVLDIERARFKEIPTFTDFKVVGTADFRGRVDKFFGVRERATGRPSDRDETPRPKAQQPTEATPKQPGTTSPGAAPKEPGATPSTPSAKPTPPRGAQPGGTQAPRKG